MKDTDKKFSVRIRYQSEARFDTWDEASTFICMALGAGMNAIEISYTADREEDYDDDL